MISQIEFRENVDNSVHIVPLGLRATSTGKMKLIILASLFAYTFAVPNRPAVVPRLLPAAFNSFGRFQQRFLSGDKIVGGSEVVPNSIPFQVLLQRQAIVGYNNVCGGTILDEKTILTAAHCVEGNDPTIFRIIAGEHNLNETSDLEQIRDVSSFKLHEDYVYDTQENDIALLTLADSLDLSVPSVKPVVLPPTTAELDPPAGTIVTVSGWGATSNGGTLSRVLLSAELPVVSDEECNAAYAGQFNPNPVKNSMMCAGLSDGGVDSCQGDSGGPLFTGSGAEAVQHGIVSWGRGCALANYPGVYTQVSYFLDWIAANRS